MNIRVNWTGLLVASLGLFLLSLSTGCANSTQTLTNPQMQKLDPALQRLVQGETRSMDQFSASERDDGTTVYSVILRSEQPEALREAGLPINSVQGSIVTARLRIAQIREAATLEAVQNIENPTQHDPNL